MQRNGSQKVYISRRSRTPRKISNISSQKAVSKGTRLIGYARVSTDDQNLAMQLDALERAGCSEAFTDEASGASRSRPGLDACLAQLTHGDVLVVWRLDRLGRSLAHLLSIVETLRETGIGFRSLTESLDTTSAGGKLVLSIFGALAEYERSLISERVRAGMTAAKKRGGIIGRRRALSRTAIEQARTLIENGEAVRAVARSMKCGVSTLYRALRY